MNRTTSPVHLHVNRKAPVHVHVSTSPSGRKSTGSVRRMKASDWVKVSTSKGPWVPPPAKSTKTRMSWEGPTHKLEIVPGEEDSTCLHYSDLGGNGSTNLILEPEASDTNLKLDSLKAEVNCLKTEVVHQRTLRELENELRASRMSLKDTGTQLYTQSPEPEITRKLQSSLGQLRESMADSSDVNTGRELLLKKILSAELDVGTVDRQVDLLKESLRLLIRDHSLSPTRAREVVEQSRLLQEQLTELRLDLKSMRRLLRYQQTNESKIISFVDDWEHVLQRLNDSEGTVQVLKSQLEDKERLASHSHELHNRLGVKESEIQTMSIRIQSLEDKLQQNELQCAKLEATLHETRRQAAINKDSLKRATKQHKERAIRSEQSVESLSQHIDDLKSDLELERSQSAKLNRERAHSDIEKQSFSSQVKELRNTLEECRRTSKSSIDVYSAKLADKTNEISSLQIENERLKASISALETQLRMNQSASESKMSIAQSDAVELKTSLVQYESLVNDYKIQLEKSHRECAELEQALRSKEQELDQIQHDSLMEKEKSKLKSQQQITELDIVNDKLKSTEAKLRETRERQATYEQRNVDQTKVIAELSTRAEHQASSVSSVKEKLHDKKAEVQALSAKVEIFEKRLQETDVQNRQLIEITSKKEKVIHQLQSKEQRLMEDVASLNKQLDSTRAELRKQTEDLRERNAAKERANLSRVADLESQLARSNSQITQLKKSKEGVERKLNSRMHDLQDRLDQSQATKKSLENYVSFLKTSYASIFNDTPTSLLN